MGFEAWTFGFGSSYSSIGAIKVLGPDRVVLGFSAMALKGYLQWRFRGGAVSACSGFMVKIRSYPGVGIAQRHRSCPAGPGSILGQGVSKKLNFLSWCRREINRQPHCLECEQCQNKCLIVERTHPVLVCSHQYWMGSSKKFNPQFFVWPQNYGTIRL